MFATRVVVARTLSERNLQSGSFCTADSFIPTCFESLDSEARSRTRFDTAERKDFTLKETEFSFCFAVFLAGLDISLSWFAPNSFISNLRTLLCTGINLFGQLLTLSWNNNESEFDAALNGKNVNLRG